ncbi:MAG: hypothetical protein IKV30_06470 [Clostridia bacterium]|nr:hypothetical protein [Clostridia bacterium]
MKKRLAFMLVLSILVCSLFYQPAGAYVIDAKVCHLNSLQIENLIKIDRELRKEYSKDEDIDYTKHFYFGYGKESNQYVHDLVKLLKTVEFPIPQEKLPYDVYYRFQTGRVNLYFEVSENAYIDYYLMSPSSEDYSYDMYKRLYKYIISDCEPFMTLSDNVRLYLEEEEYSKRDGKPAYIWSCVIQYKDYVYECEYVEFSESEAALSAEEVREIFVQAPVSTIDNLVEIEKESLTRVQLAYIICGAVVFVALVSGILIIVFVKRARRKAVKTLTNTVDLE